MTSRAHLLPGWGGSRGLSLSELEVSSDEAPRLLAGGAWERPAGSDIVGLGNPSKSSDCAELAVLTVESPEADVLLAALPQLRSSETSLSVGGPPWPAKVALAAATTLLAWARPGVPGLAGASA